VSNISEGSVTPLFDTTGRRSNLPVVAVGTVRLPDYIACANGRLSIDYRKWFGLRLRARGMKRCQSAMNPIPSRAPVRPLTDQEWPTREPYGRTDHHFVDGKTGEETDGQLA
jgi:hypothetical protein